MVSGAGRGVGAAIADRLLADGWAVSAGVRDPDKVRARFAGQPDDRVMVARFDADDPPTAQAWVDETVARFGRLDALVNNAGILRMVDFAQGDEADLDAMWQVNVKGPFRLIRAALPHLKQAGQGRVVNIASTDAKRIRDITAPLGYAMTKHALMAMTHAVRFAGWEEGVRATAICPGAIDTEMIAGLVGATPRDKRLQPETVADIVAFVIDLPNQANVAELVANTRLEGFI